MFQFNYQQFVKRNRLVLYGLPFMVILVGSSYGLSSFTSVRYKYRKGEKFNFSDLEQKGVKVKHEKTDLETEYQKLQEEMNLEQWKNVRGPRPWEDSKTIQEEQRS
ncbi:hypothetical protein LSH36_334g01005 [Paralvinella palmiformis]|uniref:Cytochrome c oxidase assembly protein COX16 homolog, mitochondrial n=1 Tax=Paralvinella palmiformis TaxID=53620 RepID=A0AAD9JFV6_9ANNE|nr:hypothetical protein LSH36_334g01005 [Paralvinella palmiformis]